MIKLFLFSIYLRIPLLDYSMTICFLFVLASVYSMVQDITPHKTPW